MVAKRVPKSLWPTMHFLYVRITDVTEVVLESERNTECTGSDGKTSEIVDENEHRARAVSCRAF